MNARSRSEFGDFPKYLAREILGQEEAVRLFAGAFISGEVELGEPDKPRSSTLSLGPTGVGKTETALASARWLWGTDHAVARIDMAEFNEKDSLKRLIGETSERQGILGEEIDRLRRDYNGGILLFDEIEKGHPDISKLLLGINDAARVRMSTGEVKDLSFLHTITTSNLGSRDVVNMADLPYSTISNIIHTAAQEFFAPEVLARFSEVIVYKPLPYEVQVMICDQKLKRYLAFLSQRVGHIVSADRDVQHWLTRKGFNRYLGARFMTNTIRRELRNVMTRWRLTREQRWPAGKPIEICVGTTGLTLNDEKQ